jgi:hypothetical protein
MKAATVIALVVLAGLAGCIYTSCKPVWLFDHLEQNAKRVVTASELQTWATNLLARNPMGTNLVPSNWGADFPVQLRKLCPRNGPGVCLYDASQSPGGNGPAWVRVAWGSGMLGVAGFEIGPTNFVSIQPGHAWQPGVYFFKR